MTRRDDDNSRLEREGPTLLSQPQRRRRLDGGRREELLNRLETLFLGAGFRSVTMDEVAATVRASKSTLYSLSPTKESLVAEVLRRFFAATVDQAERLVGSVGSQRDRVAIYLSALGHAMKRMSRDCYDDMMSLPVTREIYERHSSAAADRVHEFIEAGVDANEFRAANARFIGRAVSLLMDGIQHGELIRDTGLSSGEAYAELGSLILNSLAARQTIDLEMDAFVPSNSTGERPHLAHRVAFANLGNADIFEVWERNMRSAAERRGLDFVTANAEFDSVRNVEHIHRFIDEDVAAILVADLDAPSQRPAVVEAMERGIAVFTVAFGPGTTRIVTDQYASGQAAGQAMVRYVEEHLGGESEILMFNLDDREGVRPRYQAVRDVVATASSTIVISVDELGVPQTEEYGYEVMRRLIRAHPEISVVVGEDAHVLGALAAIEEAGLDQDPRWLLVGIGGEQRALEKVAIGSPLRIDVAFALPAIGTVPGRFGADWLAGRNIPSQVVFNPVVLDDETAVTAFLADMANPEDLFDDDSQHGYFTMLGNVSYARRPSQSASTS